MKRADAVVTYGSTSGVEAAFLGRPSILMGPSAYNLLGCAISVSSREQLRQALDERLVADIELSYPYGLFLHRRGFYFHYLSPLEEGGFNVSGVGISEASELARKVSHGIHEFRTRWYTRK